MALFDVLLVLFDEAVLVVEPELDLLSFDFAAELDFALFGFDVPFVFEATDDFAVSDLADDFVAFELAAFGFDADLSSVAWAASATISLTAPIAALIPPIAAPVAASTRTSLTVSLALSKTPDDEPFLLELLSELFALLLFVSAEDSVFLAFVVLLAEFSLADLSLSFLVGIFLSSLDVYFKSLITHNLAHKY